MDMIMAPRATGKSLALLRLMAQLSVADLRHAVCYTADAHRAKALYRDAKRLFPDRPWSEYNFATIATSDRTRRGRGKIYIDELEDCLRVLFAGNELSGVTINLHRGR